jgi:hypothetical protein
MIIAMVMGRVFFEVRTEYLNSIKMRLVSKGSNTKYKTTKQVATQVKLMWARLWGK